MAVTDSYATAVEYRGHISKSDNSADPDIDADLTGVSRWLNERFGTFWTKDAAAVARMYDGDGTTLLDLRDADNPCPGIGSLTNLAVSVDLNGDYSAETGLTINTHFWVSPRNADKGPEPHPWTALEIVPNNSVLSVWPKQASAAQVTAMYGWPAIPEAVKMATIHLTAIIRLETPRAEAKVTELGQLVQMSPQARYIVDDLARMYSDRWVVA